MLPKVFARERRNSSWEAFSTAEEFPALLSDFLFSSRGARFKPSFQFSGDLVCGRPAPPVTASKVTTDKHRLGEPPL